MNRKFFVFSVVSWFAVISPNLLDAQASTNPPALPTSSSNQPEGSTSNGNKFYELFERADQHEISNALHNVIYIWSHMNGGGTTEEEQERLNQWTDDLTNSPNDSIKFGHTLFTFGHSFSENLIEFMMAANWLLQIAPRSEFTKICKKCYSVSFDIKGPINYRTPCNEKWRKIMSHALIKYYTDPN